VSIVNDSRTRPGDEVVALVSGIVEGVFAGLKPLLAAARLCSPSRWHHRHRPGPAEPQVVELLDGLVVGAGFIAAPRLLADSSSASSVDQRAQRHPTQLFISLDPSSEYFLDYTRQSWFTVPRDTGRRHITGPYVDYLCTDEYTLTFTLPVRGETGSGFAGVVARTCSCASSSTPRCPGCTRWPSTAGQGGAGERPGQGHRVHVGAAGHGVAGPRAGHPGVVTTGEESLTRPGTTLRRCGDAPIALLTTTH